MRRWNGWGEESTVVELPDSARGFLAELVGQGARLPDASLEAALAKVPASRLEADPRYIDPVSVAACPRAEPAGLAGDARGRLRRLPGRRLSGNRRTDPRVAGPSRLPATRN